MRSDLHFCTRNSIKIKFYRFSKLSCVGNGMIIDSHLFEDIIFHFTSTASRSLYISFEHSLQNSWHECVVCMFHFAKSVICFLTEDK